MDLLTIIYIVSVIASLLIGAYKIDPTKKYRRVIIDILEKTKEITPDNIDEIITRIVDGLDIEGLNPNSRIGRKVVKEVEDSVKKRNA